MTDYRVSYRTNLGGVGGGSNSEVISRGVIDLSGFNLFPNGVSDSNAFFDAFSTSGRSFSYSRGTLVLRFTDGDDSHTISISGFSTGASVGYRVKTDSTGESDFLVSQLARSLFGQKLTNVGDYGIALDGGAGADTLIGGSGSDRLDGHAGYDTASYATSSGAIRFDDTSPTDSDGFRSVVVYGLEQSDKIKSIEKLIGTRYGDTFTVSTETGDRNDIRFIQAGAGSDTVNLDIAAGAGIAGIRLVGGAGSDTLALDGMASSGIKSLVIDLTRGRLSFVKTDAPGVTHVVGIGGFENIELTDAVHFGKWTVIGNNFANKVILSGDSGGTGVLSLLGGNDEVEFASDADISSLNLKINGGVGRDTIDFASLAKSLDVDLPASYKAHRDIDAGANVANLQLISLENVVAPAGQGLTFTGNGATNIITGSSAVDTIVGGRGVDRIQSMGGSDNIKADRSDIIIVEEDASSNYDHLSYADHTPFRGRGITIDLSKPVFDTVADLDGITRYVAGRFYFGSDDAGFNSITGSRGYDNIKVGSRVVELYGGAGNDRLTSGSRSKKVEGEAGNDILVLGAVGAEVTLDGGVGNDRFFNLGFASNPNKVNIVGGDGIDVVDFSSGLDFGIYNSAEGYGVSFTINSDPVRAIKIENGAGTAIANDVGIIVKSMSGIENAIGTKVADSITGDSGNNRLEGRVGDDILDGGKGADRLYGGDGDDTLKGGDSLSPTTDDSGITTTPTDIGNDFLRPDGRALGFTKIGTAPKNILQGGKGGDTYVIAPNSINEISDVDARTIIDFSEAGVIRLGGNGGAGDGRLLARFLQIDFVEADSDFDNSFKSQRVGNDLVIILTKTTEETKTEGGVETKESTFSSYLTTDDAYQTVTTIKNFYAAGFAGRFTFKFKGTDKTRASDADLVDVEIKGGEFLNALRGNVVEGSSADNVITGLARNDLIKGNDGADTIYGGSGADTLKGGAGADEISGGTQNDKLYGDGGNDQLRGNEGADTIKGGDDNDELYGGEGNDKLYGENHDDIIYGGIDKDGLKSGNDHLEGGSGVDELYGGDGEDTLYGGTGDDTLLDGGAGNDKIYGGDGDDTLLDGGAGNDEIYGGDGDDTLLDGGAGNDEIYGDVGIDTLQGGAGNDLLDGGAGNDKLMGGDGYDLFLNLGIFSSDGNLDGDSASGVDTIDGGDGIDFADFSRGGLSIDRSSGFGIKVDLSTSEGTSEVNGVAVQNVADVTLNRASPDNTKVASLDNVEGVYGTRYADDITGDSQDNLIGGLDGSDTLTSGGGNNRLEGGRGADTYKITAGSTTTVLDIDSGRNGVRSTIDLTNLAAIALGSDGADNIERFLLTEAVDISRVGGDLQLTITTADGVPTSLTVEDFYKSAGSYDFMFNIKDGTADAEEITIKGGKFIFGDAPKIYLISQAPDFTLNGDGLKNDYLVGRNAPDLKETLDGKGGDDVLSGLAGDDTLKGGNGGDRLIGGAGGDVLDGGSGSDTADYRGSNAGVVMTLAKAADTDFADVRGGDAAGDTIKNIEVIQGSNPRGGGFGDEFTLFARNEVDYTVYGNNGADKFIIDFASASGDTGDYLGDKLYGGGQLDTLALKGANTLGEISINFLAGSMTLTRGEDTDSSEVVGFEDLDLSGYTSDTSATDGKSLSFVGTTGNNRVTFGGFTTTGSLILDGGRGADTLDFTGRATSVDLDLGADTTDIYGTGNSIEGFEHVVGGGGADTITGTRYNNFLSGGAGDDTLQGGSGNDVIDGGAGDGDTVSYAGENTGVRVILRDDNSAGNPVVATFVRTRSRELDRIRNVENIKGSEGNDVLVGDSAVNRLEGMGGNDVIRGGGGNDNLLGGAGADTIYGGAGGDTIAGEGGDDTIKFSISARVAGGDFDIDVVDGGADEDTADFSDSVFQDGDSSYGIKVDLTEFVDETDANGLVTKVNVASVTLNRPTPNDNIKVASLDNIENVYGTGLADVITGGAEANVIKGNGGFDVIDGGAGIDTIYGGAGNDEIDGAAGDDNLYGGDGADTLSGGDGTNKLYGGRGKDSYEIKSGSSDSIYDTGGGEIDLTGLTGAAITSTSVVDLVRDGDTFARKVSGRDWTFTFTDGAKVTTLTIKDFAIHYAGYTFKLAGTEFSGGALRNSIIPRNIRANSEGEFFGSLGANTMTGGDGAQTFDGLAGNDRLYGLRGIDTLKGGAGNDIINGGAGDDDLIGGDGDDRFIGLGVRYSGADTIDGGAGQDIAYFNGAGAIVTLADKTRVSAGVTIDMSNIATAAAVTGGRDAKVDESYGTLTNVEEIVGSRFTDTITLKISDAVSNKLSFGAGRDVLKLSDSAILATDRQDIYDGGQGTDTLDLSAMTSASIENHIVLTNFDNAPVRPDFFVDNGITPEIVQGTRGKDALSSQADSDALLIGGGGYDTYTITKAVAFNVAGEDVYGISRSAEVTDSITRIRDNGGLIDLSGFSGLSDGGVRSFLTGDNVLGSISGGNLILSIKQPNVGEGFTDTVIVIENYVRNARSYNFKLSDEVSYRGDTLLPYVVGENDGYITRKVSSGSSDRVAILRNFEDVIGSAGNDHIFGTNVGNIISGGGGNDVIYGDSITSFLYGVGAEISSDKIRSTVSIDGQRDRAAGRKDKLDGGDGNDIIYGMAGDDEIDGGANDDSLYGGRGNDIISGGLGSDVILGQFGNDIIDGGDGDDSLYGDLGDDFIIGGAGEDRISGGAGIDTLSYQGSPEGMDSSGVGTGAGVTLDLSVTDELYYSYGSGGHAEDDKVAGVENVVGSDHDDTITGFDAGNGQAWSSGFIVDDTNTFQSWQRGIGSQIDHAIGSRISQDVNNGANKLEGRGGNDVLKGLGGNDVLLGGDGNDVLHGGSGNDVLNGGEGIDTVSYEDDTVGVTITLQGATNAIFRRTGSREFDTIRNVENIKGSQGNDILNGNRLENKIEGLGGNDLIRGGAGDDVIDGGAGNDEIYGGAGVDVIDGGAGDDTIKFSSSTRSAGVDFAADVVDGGAGEGDIADFSKIYFQDGGVRNRYGITVDLTDFVGTSTVGGVEVQNVADVNLNRAGDALQVASLDNIENVYGTGYADAITGGAGANVIKGNGGADTIYGGGGADTIYGGGGIDTIYGGGDGDIIYGDDGNDVIEGGTGNDKIYGGSGIDVIEGGAGVDVIEGGTGNDTLKGDAGDDTITGGAGNDIIYGGAGENTLTGGRGADTYHIADASENIITDGGGTIDLTALGDLSKLNGLGLGDLKTRESRITFLEHLNAGTVATHDSAVQLDSTGLTLKIGKTGGTSTSIRLEGFTLANAGSFKFKLSDGTADGSYDIKGTDLTSIISSTQRATTANKDLTGGVFSDRLVGKDRQVDTLDGAGGGDTLLGKGGDDILNGGAGNDLLIGGAGADTIDGGDGEDTVSYYASGRAVTLALTADQSSSGFVGTGGHAEGDTISNVEKFIGTRFGDTFTLTAADVTKAYTLDAGRGTDTLKLSGTSSTDFAINLASGTFSIGGSTSTISNIERIDISSLATTSVAITGSDGVDNIFIGDGADAYSNRDGTTGVISGSLGAGNDILYVGNYDIGSSFTLTGGAGVDKVDFSARTSGAIFDFAGSEFEQAIGSKQDDIFTSDNNANRINGGLGQDTIDYSNADSFVVVNLGLGAYRRAQTGSVASQGDFLSNIENILGSDYSDILIGSRANNVITGGGGADTIKGGAGIDTVSYAGSSTGVNVDLHGVVRIGSFNYGYGRGGDAEGDKLLSIENIIGSDRGDRLTGNRLSNHLEGGAGDDALRGGAGSDTYIFESGDGMDRVFDDGGKIVFAHGENDDYVGAKYTFVRNVRSDAVTLMVSKDGNTLNIIKFTSDPFPSYGFYTRSGGTDTELPASSLVVFAEVLGGGDGSESNPFLGSTSVDIFEGSADADWVSYAGLNQGVTVDLSANPAIVSGGASGDTLRDIVNLVGSNLADTFIGNNVANFFAGGGGDDVLSGGDGLDSYMFSSGDGRDMVTDDGGKIIFLEGDSDEYADVTYSFIRSDGGSGDAVTLTVIKDGRTLNIIDFASDPTSSYSFYTRSDGIDTEVSASLLVVPEKLGSEGNPYIGSAAVDSFVGSAGIDWVSYAGSSESVAINLGDTPIAASGGWATDDVLSGINHLIGSDAADGSGDRLVGNSAGNILRGGGGDDLLRGEAGSDSLYGGADSDILFGGTGADIIDGGLGVDTARYISSVEGVRVSLLLQEQGQQQGDFESNNFGFVANNNDAVGDTLIGIENIYGSRQADWLTGDGNSNTLTGLDGNDRLEGGGEVDTYVFRVNEGTDIVVDDGGKIVFDEVGGSGYTGASYSFVRSGGGRGESVTLTVSKDGNTLNVIEFTSYLSSGYSFYTRRDGIDSEIDTSLLVVPPQIMGAGSEDDPFLASAVADSIVGSAGADWFSYAGSSSRVEVSLSSDPATAYGGWATGDMLSGINNLIGSSKGDDLSGSGAINTLRGGAGKDVISGSGGADILYGEEDNDGLYGGDDGDTLYGGAGNDELYGGDDGDTLYGGTGNDRLDGGSGEDIIDGGAGADTATYGSVYRGVGVRVSLLLQGEKQQDFDGTYGFTANNNRAVGDILSNIERLYGTRLSDWLTGDGNSNILWGNSGNDLLEGGAGNDHLDGGSGSDSYLFSAGDGIDTVFDYDGGKIIFLQGTNNDYEGASYSLVRSGGGRGDDVRLTVSKDGNTLNIIEFSSGSSSGFSLYTRSGETDIEIPASSFVVPPQLGIKENPYLGTASADSFTGSSESDVWVSYVGSPQGVTIDFSNHDDNGIPFAIVSDGWAAGDTLINIANLLGSEHGDTLIGSHRQDSLEGGRGNDVLVGGRSNDNYLFNAGDGKDRVTDDGGTIIFLQGTNNDYDGASYTFTYVDGNVRLTVAKDGSTLNVIEFTSYDPSDYYFYTRSSDGSDTRIPASSFVVSGGGGDGSESDPFWASDTSDSFTGSDTNDWVSYAGSDSRAVVDLRTSTATVSSAAAGDTLIGINNLIGSGGYYYSGDTLKGNSNPNILLGRAGSDGLYGFEGNDRLEGGSGDDRLDGGAGADTLAGGDGSDDVYYDNSIQGVRVNLLLQGEEQRQQDFETNDFGFVANGNEAVGDILSDIENIRGSAHNDWLTGDDNGNSITGGAGNDRIEGGDGNDNILGEDGDDTLYGEGGDDLLIGGGGRNTLDGGAGNDVLYGGSDVDILEGGEDNDILDGGGGMDTLIGGDGADTAGYTSNNDEKGVRVNLLLQGEQQRDFETNDFGFTGNGNDAVGDILTGIENIEGTGSADWLTGDGNSNILWGNRGNDHLEGGAGNDVLYGGGGEDTYVFNAGDGTDTITGSGEDGDNIVFQQGTNNDYEGASYTYDYIGSSARLTVAKDGITLNVIEFTNYPTDYNFYTSGGGIDTEIPASSLVAPARRGIESNPFLASASAETFTGENTGDSYYREDVVVYDWVSYEGSNEGVTIDLSNLIYAPRGWVNGDRYLPAYISFATVSDGWAAGDRLVDINNLIGSEHADTLTGNGNNNVFEGGRGNDILNGGENRGTNDEDTYLFNAGDGTDTLTDPDGGRIVFLQGSNDDYDGASYDFTYSNSFVRLTVIKDGSLLNAIDFTSYPSDYSFYTRSSDGSESELSTSSLILPTRFGIESNPFLASVNADTFIGSGFYNWVSYAGSDEGVSVDLSTTPATVSAGWAADDLLTGISHLIGSEHGDIFRGDYGSNIFVGGLGTDTLSGLGGEDSYVFNAGDGTDTVTDDGGNIIFLQGDSGDAYEGASYSFARHDGGDAVTLTVSKDGVTLNVIEFTSYPSSGYSFYTRGGGRDTRVSDSLLVVPDKRGIESNPFLASSIADTFAGSEDADWVSYASSASGVKVDLSTTPATVSEGWAADDTLSEINNLLGSAYEDELAGNNFANTLDGGDGNDILNGGGGADILSGGIGDEDVADYRDSASGVRVNLLLQEQGHQQRDFETNSFGFVANNNEAVGDLLSGMEVVSGSHSSDWLTGDVNNNRLVGLGGNDRLEGGSGADILLGGHNDDKLYGGDGADKLYGGDDNDHLEGGIGDDLLHGGSGADTIAGGAGIDTARYFNSFGEGVRVNLGLTGGQEDFDGSHGFASNDNDAEGDILSGIENLVGSSGNDWLTGNEHNNEIVGGKGFDRLEGGLGLDTYVFSRFDNEDTIVDDGGKIVFLEGGIVDYAGATYTFVRSDGGRGNSVTLTVRKDGSSINVIEFTNYPTNSGFSFYTRNRDGIETEIASSLLAVPAKMGDGSEDNPYLATDVSDSFTGSVFRDWVSYAGSSQGVTIDLSSNPATVSDGWATGDTLSYIDNLIGSNYGDILTGDSGRNTLRGGDGKDSLRGGGDVDYLEGGAGADVYIFDDTSGNDVIRSDPDGGSLHFRGHSSYDGFAHARDYEGNAVFVADDIQITFEGDAYQHGNYKVYYGASDTLYGNIYIGSGVADTLTGGNSKDVFVSFGGDDTLIGGRGDDLMFGGDGSDRLYGQDGIDSLFGGADRDFLYGDSGEDILFGEGGNDVLYGGADSDFLYGGDGNDLLQGGSSPDYLRGQGGADTYRFDALDSVDVIAGHSDGRGNKLVFRAPESISKELLGFDFQRGFFTPEGQEIFTENARGDDLRIEVSTWYLDNRGILREATTNIVYVEDYFDYQFNDAYTIYRTDYGSGLDGTVVSGQPDETS